MTIRLKGKSIGYSYPDGETRFAEIELPPLPRKPEVGVEVLLKKKILRQDWLDLNLEDMFAILPPTQLGEEKCICSNKYKNIPETNQFCPIHGKKVEEEQVSGFIGQACEHKVMRCLGCGGMFPQKPKENVLAKYDFRCKCGKEYSTWGCFEEHLVECQIEVKRPDASTEAKVHLPEKFGLITSAISKEIIADRINHLIDYLKWKESHDQSL